MSEPQPGRHFRQRLPIYGRVRGVRGAERFPLGAVEAHQAVDLRAVAIGQQHQRHGLHIVGERDFERGIVQQRQRQLVAFNQRAVALGGLAGREHRYVATVVQRLQDRHHQVAGRAILLHETQQRRPCHTGWEGGSRHAAGVGKGEGRKQVAHGAEAMVWQRISSGRTNNSE